MDADDLALLERVALNTGTGEERGLPLNVVVTACAYSCCGKGWQRRDGYEQPYTGWIDNLNLDEPVTFMLYAVGIGTITYVCAIRAADVELVEIAPGLAPVTR